MRILIGVIAIVVLVWLSVLLTDALDRRRALGRLTLERERGDDDLTILAKRRAERVRQRQRFDKWDGRSRMVA